MNAIPEPDFRHFLKFKRFVSIGGKSRVGNEFYRKFVLCIMNQSFSMPGFSIFQIVGTTGVISII
jgi:hypothetical protein